MYAMNILGKMINTGKTRSYWYFAMHAFVLIGVGKQLDSDAGHHKAAELPFV
jgi:hypothetical protein